jgi:hypothetical protein
VPPIYRPRAWHLLVVALIAIFDLGVLWMVLRPQVAQDYYDYYIDRSASCFPRITSSYYPLGQPVSFVPGRSGYKLDTVRWCGFMPPSTTGIRSFGDYGILRLKFADPGQNLLLTFTSWVNTDKDKTRREVEVLVNGERVGTLTFATALRVDGKLIIPARLVTAGKGEMQIRFNMPRTGPPGTNGEPVTLQLRLESMRLVPLSEASTPSNAKETGVSPSPRSRRA